MSVGELLKTLSERQIELSVMDGKLRYQGPRSALDDEIVARIRESKTALIAHLSQEPSSDRDPSRHQGETCRLSPGQEALWFLFELDRESLAYNILFAVRLSPEFDLSALRAALQDLHLRHPVLRSRFGLRSGTPYQQVVAPDGVDLQVTQTEGWSPEEIDEHLSGIGDLPFDLEKGPLARWHLLTRVGGSSAPTPALALAAHHSIVDFRSLEILSRDLGLLYSAHLEERPAALPPLTWSYHDYVRASRDWVNSEAGRRSLAYWLDELDGELPVLDLPTDFPRPSRQRHEGAALVGQLPEDLTERIESFCRQHQVTPNSLLLSVLGILLHRYSRQAEVLIGSPMLGRTRGELGDIVGYFVNSVVLRLQFGHDPNSGALLAQVQQKVLDALAHQEYPFSFLVERLQPERDHSRSPIFQVAFVYERETAQPIEQHGLFGDVLHGGQRGAAFDLTVTALVRGGACRLTWEYAAALFRPQTIERMAGHFQRLLSALLDQPQISISRLSLLTPAEEHQLEVWNRTEAPYTSDRTLIDLFQAQAAKSPQAVALDSGREQLTYAELLAKADGVARRLQALGVGRNCVAGVALTRSTDQIVALLGLLTAGGACLSLDPDHPGERIRYMLDQSGASFLLTLRDVASKLPRVSQHVVTLDSFDDGDPETSTTTLTCPAGPEDLLYVLYTSGSTGEPKGVAMPQRPLVNLVDWHGTQPGLDRPARTLQFTSLTFDVAFQEIAVTLCSGGTLVLVDEETRRDSARLLQWIADQRVERLFMPFVALQHLSESAANGDHPKHLRDVVTAGEQLRITPAIRRFFQITGCRLHNHYGPTESHVATALTLSQSAQDWEDLPSIGTPIANVRIHLLDGQQQAVPVGVPGEIHIGGVAPADGYINRPDLTAERFIEHPRYERIYRTGDLARRRPDGELEFLGRLDRQVKLRGFRVEPGEVEAVLGRHPAVREAAVVVHGGEDSPRLAAYVSTSADEGGLAQELKAHLRSQLPDYMVPATLAVLERLPLTSTGKLDRLALPAPDPQSEDRFVAPRTQTETLLASIWTTLLAAPSVSANASFFELGGHSLLATRLMSRVRDAFSVELPLHALFENPTVAKLASLIEQERGAPSLPPLKAQIEGAELQLSFGQQRLWFLDQLEGPSPTYSMPATLALDGPLDEPALRKALGKLVARHVSLRLVFPAHDGKPRARILAAYDPLNLTDLSTFPEADRQAEAQRLSQAHAAQPFDLAHGPLLRLHLLRLDEDRHWLLFAMHHIISDGWSLGVLARDLSALYAEENRGAEGEIPEIAIQYPDYSAWQRAWLRSDVLDEQASYWEQQLADAPTALEMPTDRPRPPRLSYRGALHRRPLEPSLAERVREFSSAHGCTVFMTLLTAFNALLSRQSGQTDIVVGTPVANRRHQETEELIGLFVNTLAIRTRLEDQPSFADLARQARRTCLDAFLHQDLPFDSLVDRIQPERSLAHAPLFQVMFVLQNAPMEDLRLQGLRVDQLPPPLTVAKFDLTLSVEEKGEGFETSWEYSTDLFEVERIERLAAQFDQLLRSALAHPQRPVATLAMLPDAELRQLAEWGLGPRRELAWESVVAAFERQAARTPMNPAVVSPQRSIDYQSLNRRANQLARLLREQGVGASSKTAVCLRTGVDVIVGVMAVLKAGAAYLPLDPNYPAARLEWILKDSQADLLLSHSTLSERLPQETPQTCFIDREAARIEAQPIDNLPAQAGPEDLVYVIYTSGSTGRPKGAGAYHRSFANLLHWYIEALNLAESDRALLISALGFDLTQKNLFAPLLVGGSLHMPSDPTYDADRIAQDISAQAITWINCTPSAFYPLLGNQSTEELQRLSTLRWVVLGGEPIQPSRFRAWADSTRGQSRVMNSYGPTECTDVCAAWVLEADSHDDLVPLGHPIPNVSLSVRDEHLQPVPLGSPGELLIGGIGVGTGYLNRPELNAAKFVRVDSEGRRTLMYRTGDRVVWRRDGSLLFLGRGDNQIKHRGFRIELGEIESALLEEPAISEAVVVVRGAAEQQRLVAYLVGDGRWDEAALSSQLERKLPTYMLPDAFVRLERLPLTANRKVDRRSLPDPEEPPVPLRAEPKGPTETLLAEIWSSLLGLERIDRNADFFQAGGHSLLATQLVARIKHAFRTEIQLRSLFEQPTLAALAALIDSEKRHRLPPLLAQPAGSQRVLSFAQQRLWFLDQLEGNSTAYHMPATLELRGALDVQALRRTFLDLVVRHESLRTRFPSADGVPWARLTPLYDPLSVTDLSGLPRQWRSDEARRQQAACVKEPFDLARGPLFRLRLVALEPQLHWLLFDMHHIVSDGWSIDVLIREVSLLYAAHRGRSTPKPAPLPIRYSDFAAWQRQWLEGELLEEQLDYWRAQLSDAPELLSLPTDFPRPAMQRFAGGAAPLRVDAALARRLKTIARAQGGTLFMALIAAFNVLLHRFSGQADLSLGTPVANRNLSDLEGVVGLFLNTLVLRSKVQPEEGFSRLLSEVRRTALAAFAHQDLPFEHIVERLQPERSLSHNPLFQVMLNLVNTRSAEIQLDGIEVDLLTPPQEFAAKFDLNLSLTEMPDGGLEGRFEYNATLFNYETIRFLGDCFLTLVDQIVARPQAPLTELSLLSPAWRAQVANTRQPHPHQAPVDFGSIERSIHDRFAEQAARFPERQAVRTPQRSLTYAALDRAARVLAGELLQLKASARVGLLLPHDERMVVGLMGVLQAGRAYVPLDAAHPLQRLNGILEDAEASVIVCATENLGLAKQLAAGACAVLDIDALDGPPVDELPSTAPDSVAYLLYTSGSSGKPKGVIQSHRNVLHFIREYSERLRIGAEDRLLQLASFSFDAAVMDIFGALLNGATLYPLDLRSTSMVDACSWTARQGITIYHSTPTVFRHFVTALGERLPAVRLVVLGGEMVVRADLEAFRSRFDSHCIFVNGLGPTESTVSLQYFLDSSSESSRFSVPVGFPVGGTEALLLDAEGRPTELYGEIAVRSPYVALGYWRQEWPSLIQDQERPGKRIWRSGDLGRLLPDGSLEVLGRLDRQIKLRGFRIELGEIEATLRQHPSVRETAVVLWPLEQGLQAVGSERFLVAYVSGSVGRAELKEFCRSKLPDYMVPSHFVALADLPMTVTGKLDRRSLPEPAFDSAGVGGRPLSESETLLAGLWSDLLSVEVSSAEAHFFELGGHSLLATQLASRIRDRLGVEVPLQRLFELPLLREQAAELESGRRGRPLPPIEPLPQGSQLPLSFAQQRLWFLDQLEGGSQATYNITAALELRGELDESALQRCLRQLTERHQSLRMNFLSEGGRPRIVLREPYDPLSWEDGRGRPDLEDWLRREADEHASRPFDLSRDALLRLRLLRAGEDRRALLFSVHHIAADGWSLQVLVRELAALYAASCEGGESPLAPPRLQYADYAAWQRGWLRDEELERQLEYWREQLADGPGRLNLPADRARPSSPSHRGGQLPLRLSGELVEGLCDLSRREGATLYMTLLAGLQALLHRVSGQGDVSVGSPIANRTHGGTEDLVGFFVNTLVLRSRLQGWRSFRDALRSVRETALSAYAHQDVPFELLAERLQPERRGEGSPLFQVMFGLQEGLEEDLRLGDLEVRQLEQSRETAKFDLTLNLERRGDEVSGSWEYSADLFERTTIEGLSGRWVRLLKAALSQPDAPIGQLEILTREEREQLARWSANERPYPSERGIAELFSQQAWATPHAVALMQGDEEWSYGRLEERSNRLAHFLKERLGPLQERLVGVLLERSPELIAALLGILKAGGAYLPLDPEYPSQRLELMIEDSAAVALLTQSALRQRLPRTRAEVLCLEAEAEAIESSPAEALQAAGGGDRLAYVIYTSGSTGRPKGAAVPQRGVVRLVKRADYAALEADQVFVQYAPISFDASTLEIWGPLLNGARLAIMAPGRRSLSELCGELSRRGATTLWLTSSLFNLAIEEDPAGLRGLRQLLVGGEALSAAHVDKALKELPGCRLVNGYGPTENTTFSCAYAIGSEEGRERIPIGGPIANSTAFILDEGMGLSPLGATGELYVGGDGLARGYVGDPAQTAQRFLPHPFGEGERLYRTGDLARWRNDGSMEFLGRLDGQVKLRGYRIELGEVEAALRSQEQVKDAAAAVIGEGAHRRLVAWVQASQGRLDEEAVLHGLKKRLPSYMLPGRLVEIERLPLTANGKVDRAALPEPAQEGLEPSQRGLTAAEELLARLWSEVLGVEGIGRESHFFEVGGHSLLATQLASRIRDRLGVEVPIRKLFELPLLREQAAELESGRRGRPLPPIEPLPQGSQLPLSFAQQRLWFLDQLEGGSQATYNITAALELRGELDESALRRCLRQLTERHQSLRMNFLSEGGRPRIVLREPYDPLTSEDGRGRPDLEDWLRREADEHASRPFDLSRDALLRLRLLRAGEDRRALLFSVHHIAADGWSLQVLVRELATLYAASCEGGESPLAPPRLQYADYAAWQRGWLSDEELERQLGYWREQLADGPGRLNLPLDRARPSSPSHRGGQLPLRLSGELVEGLCDLSRREGATLYMTLLAGLQALLHRVSGQGDVSVGSPIANRTHGGTEDLVGFFVNTLVLRSRLQGWRSFRDALSLVRETALSAYAHQDVPFELLAERLQPERRGEGSPLFQVMFGLQEGLEEDLRLGDLEVRQLEQSRETAKFDLTLNVERRGDEVSGSWEYSADLFEASTVERLSRRWVRLLEAALSQPDAPIGQLEILTREEREQLSRWSANERPYPSERGIAELFSQQASATPHAVALMQGDQEWSYGRLEERSNRLAHYLRERLGPLQERLVGVLLERSPELIAALLGILKAGGAYLPLDPEYPSQRLELMIEDSAAVALLTQSALRQRLPRTRAEVLCLEAEAEAIESSPAEPLQAAGGGDRLAYVIYTSGSTGRPKGAAVPQRGVVRLVKRADYAALEADQVFVQYAPISFDASTLEIWGPLLNGARLAIMAPGRRSLSELCGELRRRGATTLWLTSSLFNLAIEEDPAGLRGLRQLLVGGEALSAAHVDKALKELPGCRLVNGYGPTENTTFSCSYAIGSEEGRERIPIGGPIANSTAFILDEGMGLSPLGATGELYVGGDGLARGYVGDPAQTAQRFLPHPFGEGERLYRTGDLARWRNDGSMEFLGRLDGQVKLRGFRIELGEVEAALRSQEQVKDAAAAVIGEGAHRRLVAWVQASQGGLDEEAVLHGLKKRLPSYMLPGRLVEIERLPLTANGKVDRAALPEPAQDGLEPSQRALRPTEESLAQLWSEVLGVEGIGRESHFFELGGHSLLATQLASRIRERLGLEVPLQRLFEVAVLRDQALLIDSQRRRQSLEKTLPRVERSRPLLLSFAQERLWFLNQLEPDNPFYNSPLALRLSGPMDEPALQAALVQIAQRHEVLRTAFPNRDGAPEQRILPDAEVQLAIRDLTQLPPAQRKTALFAQAEAEAARPFTSLARAPLWRAALVKLEEQEHALLLTFHHIIIDGWSLNVLTRELVHFYNRNRTNDEVELPPLPIQYADFAGWQRTWLRDKALGRQLDYWRRQLSQAPPLLTLPADHRRPARQSFRGGSVRFDLDRTTRDRLHKMSRNNDATLFMSLLTAFAVLLYRYSGQDDIVIGSPIANRQRAELEPLLGFFVNTLALRIRLGGRPSFKTLLGRVRETALSAYAHQDLPFEKLVDELQPERDLSRNPLFQVMCALQNAPFDQVEATGLEMKPLDIERRAALFDLVLDFWDRKDGIHGVLEYNCDLFEKATAKRLTRHLRNLLRAAAANPDSPIGYLSLMDFDERQHLVRLSNGPALDHPIQQSLAAAFESQARSAPERIAAVSNGERLDYQTLNERANFVAAVLTEAGATPHQPVGVLAPRGPDYLAAILGVVKAGGAFLPLDTAYPLERLRFMIEDSATPVLVAGADEFDALARGGLPASLKDVVIFDAQGGAEATPPGGVRLHSVRAGDRMAEDPPVVNGPRDPLYMLYTSGSTGQPKGALVRHDGALNHIYAEYGLLGFHSDSAFLQSAPASSDISVWQCLAPLLIGGRVVFADFETVCRPEQLLDLIRQERVSLIELVPVVLEELLTCAAGLPESRRSLPDLECAMVTGEAASLSLVNRWFEFWPETPLVNAYGPTEAADDICQYTIHSPLPETEPNVSIGRPLDNLSVVVLDSEAQLVPIGVPGEICVSGVGVGAGYWRQPRRTAAAFLPNPHAPETLGECLYRTGDLGRWRSDGLLEFAGRLDHQVKIRGFRIELGEIEASLTRHPQVREAVVIDCWDERGERRLASYLQIETAPEKQDEFSQQQVDLWKDLHERSYEDTSVAEEDPTFNTIGWDSTYTGQPLSPDEMRECVEGAVERILATRPRRLLEIGCGTGLLLYRLVPRCDHYVGTDLSTVAIQQLQASQMCLKVQGLDRAVLRSQRADDFEGLGAGSFDTLVLNSVVQYFPSADYLLRVLSEAVRRCASGGAIFIGDVRSLPLLSAYHASIQCFKAGDEMTSQELIRRIEAHKASDQELSIAPSFFEAIRKTQPRVTSATIRPKRGRLHNELTRFRYDVLLHIESEEDAAPCPDHAWQDWRRERLGLEEILQRLRSAGPELWGLRHVANARLSDELALGGWLRHCEDGELVRDFKMRSQAPADSALDPEALWRIGEELDYEVEIQCEPEGDWGSFAVLFRRRDVKPVRVDTAMLLGPSMPQPLTELVSNPLQERFSRGLLVELREFLKNSLPQHMIPSSFNVLDRFPLTPAGKIDRQALPAPSFESSGGDEYVAPQTDAERALQAIWAEVLGRENPGVQDNFFVHGGHSLKATQVVSRIQTQLHKPLALRDFFNHPTIAELAAVLDREQERAGKPSIPITPRADHYPVSQAQQRLWVLCQMEGVSAAYQMVNGLRLQGELDAGAFARAHARLFKRHESLRTEFVEVSGELRQRVAEVEGSLSLLDLSSHPAPLQAARKHALQDARERFDLSRAPLVRIQLLKIGDEDHVLLFNMHHIISDGWSMDVLVREFIQLYGAERGAMRNPLPELRIQHRDFVAWQRERLASRAAGERDYWRRQLEGVRPLNLATDFPRPPVKTYTGARRELRLDQATLDKLNSLALQQEASLFMLLTALVKSLLYRVSDETDICIGSPVACRDHEDLENQIGFFVNTLVLRDRIEGEQSFASFVERVRETAIAAYAHQDFPFDEVVQAVKAERDPSRNPLFDVMLVVQNTANIAFELPQLEIASLGLEYGLTQFDLLWSFSETSQGLQVELRFNTDLFHPASIEEMLQQWKTLVQGALAAPQSSIDQLPLLDSAAMSQLLAISEAPPHLRPVHSDLVTWFEWRVSSNPEAVALTDGERQMTYAQLNARANRTARRLRRRLEGEAVDGGSLVGLSAERCADLVIGILAILKAGCAYVPLDPDAPPERQRFILEDARVPLLVTQRRLLDNLPDDTGQLLFLDDDPKGAQEDAEDLGLRLSPRSAAYVIYTSGSTGRPKGTVVSHANLCRLFSATDPWFRFSAQDVWTLFHSAAFDFSVWEIWGALLHGGRLVVVPYAATRDPERFHHILTSQKVTVLNQTPSAFRQLMPVDLEQPNSLPMALRYVIFGGEALDPRMLLPWIKRHGDESPRLVNMYGITETTVHVTYRPIRAEDANQSASLIGQPIPDLFLYVLDSRRQPVPLGVPGELYVGGAGVAEGYLNRETLTAERFVEDPFHSGRRLYRTGDLVRRRPADGELEYLGRCDSQVKLRGFRIELGEIEAALTQQPGVSEAVVALRGQGDDAALVAYCVSRQESCSGKELRGGLLRELPAYMVPARFVTLEELPLTVNGKLDYRALPDPGSLVDEAAETQSTLPVSGLESELLAIWQDRLSLPALDVNDNVFESGAHSIMAVQVRNELEEKLGRKLPVVLLFQYPTVRALAAQIEGKQESETAGPEQAMRERAQRRRAAAARMDVRKRSRASLDPKTPIEDDSEKVVSTP